jgi:hypothetical protein
LSRGSRLHLLPLVAVLAVVMGACGATTRSGELEPRYVAVHNALAAMGMAEVGPLVQGSLAEGREERLPLELPAACTTIVAIGTRGVRDVDLALLSPTGEPIAHDVSREPEATLRACVETAGKYTLVVKMAAGGGDYLVATWAGGSPEGPAASPVPLGTQSQFALGTCESPIPLAAGSYSGSTSRGESENEANTTACPNSAGRELVYKLELASRERVTVEVDAQFDSVLYIRKDDCTESDAEVVCNDDAGNAHQSKVDVVLEPATYFVFVDGYNTDGGSFNLKVSVKDVPSIADVCRGSALLAPGAVIQSTTSDTFDRFNAGCGGGAKGPDKPYKLTIDRRSRVRVVESSTDFAPVVHVRRQCADDSTEIGCSDSGGADHEAAYVATLDPGTYTVIADGVEHDSDGSYSIGSEVAPEQGSGTQGDTCGDAIPLSRSDPQVQGDTFLAKDDVAGRCSGAGAGDVIYRVEVPRRSRVVAHFAAEEGEHVFSLMRTCADKTTEIVCERNLDQVLTAGTYFLTVDGASGGATGRFTFEWTVRDVAGQEAACRSAPVLPAGQAVTGTTLGAGDKFNTSCGGAIDAQSSGDRVYRLVLAARAHVRVTLATPSWDGVLAIRSTCLDPSGGSANPRASELACNNDSEDVHHSRIDTTLDAGTYYVLVDGHAAGNEGTYSLEYKVIR